MKFYVACTKSDPRAKFVDGKFRQFLVMPDTVNTEAYGVMDNDTAEVRGQWMLAHDPKIGQNDIIGFEHYRRFFIRPSYEPQNGDTDFDLLDEPTAANMLYNNDVILAPIYLDQTSIMAKLLTSDCCRTDSRGVEGAGVLRFLTLAKGLDPKFANLAVDCLTKRKFYGHNMFVGPKFMLANYMQWLMRVWYSYSVMYPEAVNPKTFPHALGYIGEMMFGVWLICNNYKIVDGQRITFTKDLKELTAYQQTVGQADVRLAARYAVKYPALKDAVTPKQFKNSAI